MSLQRCLLVQSEEIVLPLLLKQNKIPFLGLKCFSLESKLKNIVRAKKKIKLIYIKCFKHQICPAFSEQYISHQLRSRMGEA